MNRIVGNTTATPMTVADLSQTIENRADFVKNKKLSLLENDAGYVKNTDYATENVGGVVKVAARVNVSEIGVFIDESGFVKIAPATQSLIKGKSGTHRPITPDNLDFAVSCATNQEWKSNGYTEEEKVLPMSTAAVQAFVSEAVANIGGGANVEYATEEKAGIVQFADIGDVMNGVANKAVSPLRLDQGLREKSLKDIMDKETTDNQLPVSAPAVWDYVDNAVANSGGGGGSASVEYATTEKAGIVRLASIDDISYGGDDTVLTPYGFNDALMLKTLQDITDRYNTHPMLPVSAPAVWGFVDSTIQNQTISDITTDKANTPPFFLPDVQAVWGYVDAQIGDIDSALDAILAIQETLVGGVN